MADTTIPKQLYVTIQFRQDTKNEDGLLGFASPYTKDAAFEKRKKTQDHWAYGGADVTIDPTDESITVLNGGTRGGYGGGEKWDAGMLFIANCFPRILDNTPVEGFQIGQTVRRYGWGGSGNVKWRITDPRGFDLEISSENFASVIDCCTMVNGVIQDKCCWGRLGANNILLPESSAPYIEAANRTTKLANKTSLKDVKVGDWVEVMNGYSTKDKTLQFKGLFKVVETGNANEDNYRYSGGAVNLKKIVKDRYIFADDEGELYSVGSPKIGAIVRHEDNETKEQLVARVNKEKLKIYGCAEVQFISADKINLDEVTIKLIPEPDYNCNGGHYPINTKKSYYSTMPMLCVADGEYWWTFNDSSYSRSGPGSIYKANQHKINREDVAKGILRKEYANYANSPTRNNWGYNGSIVPILRNPATNDVYVRIALEYKGETYLVDDVGYF